MVASRSPSVPPKPGVRAAGTVLGRALGYLLPWRRSLAAASVLLGLQSAFTLVPAVLVKSFIDQLTRAHVAVASVATIVVAAAIAATAASICGAIAEVKFIELAQGVAARLREEVFARLIGQTFAFHTRTRAGEMTSVLMNDIGGIAEGLGDPAPQLLRGALTGVVALGAMIVISPVLALITLAVLPVIVVVLRLVARTVYRARQAAQEQLADVTAFAQEWLGLSGLMVVRSFGRAGYARERFRLVSEDLRAREVSLSRTVTWILNAGQALLAIGPLLVVAVGGVLVAQHNLGLGSLLGFTAVAVGVFGPALHSLSVSLAVLGGSSALWERVFSVLDAPPEITDRPTATALEAAGELSLHNITFTYPGKTRPALRDVSFEAKPGQLVALVGPSGAGKTTVASAIARFIDPQQGCVRLDGCDIRDITLDSLSEAVGVSFQDSFLFHSSIRENLLLGRPDASENVMASAVRAANLEEVIARLPDGYDTVVGERGHALSGGERQRVALARLIMKNPRVVVLDEATSHLDSASERLIREALHRVRKGRTSVVIAHRLSTIHDADWIVVLDHGQVVAQGTHEYLISQGGLYAELYALQAVRDPLVTPGE